MVHLELVAYQHNKQLFKRMWHSTIEILSILNCIQILSLVPYFLDSYLAKYSELAYNYTATFPLIYKLYLISTTVL